MNLFALTANLYPRPLGLVTSGVRLGPCLPGGSLNCTGVTNAPGSPEFRAMQDELVQPWREPIALPVIESFDESDLMNAPFSPREFSAALASCGVRTAPGLDGVEYRVVRGLPSLSRVSPCAI